jgi:putative membrane protein
MRLASRLALLAGLCLVGFLILDAGMADVFQRLTDAGPAILAVLAVRIGVTALAGLGWYVLVPPVAAPALHVCVSLRFVREAINVLLPVAQIGGEIVGARLLALRGTPAPIAAASVVSDVLVQVVTQFLFTVLGVLVLFQSGLGGAIARSAAAGLVVAALALAGFAVLQRRGAGDLVLRALRRFAGDGRFAAIAGATDAFYAALQTIQRRGRAMLASAAIHLGAWLFGSLEVYFALRLMGFEISLAEALVIESLAHAVRGAAFAVPGALGVQEGGFIVIAGLFGVPAEVALVLSLVKRVPDLVIGLPGLMVWQRIEGRHALARSQAREAGRPRAGEGEA